MSIGLDRWRCLHFCFCFGIIVAGARVRPCCTQGSPSRPSLAPFSPSWRLISRSPMVPCCPLSPSRRPLAPPSRSWRLIPRSPTVPCCPSSPSRRPIMYLMRHHLVNFARAYKHPRADLLVQHRSRLAFRPQGRFWNNTAETRDGSARSTPADLEPLNAFRVRGRVGSRIRLRVGLDLDRCAN